ncbi:MAG: hypothetical protein ACP5IO_06990 [Elusimicrobiales bacterium]
MKWKYFLKYFLLFVGVFFVHIVFCFYTYYKGFKDIFISDIKFLWLIYLKQEDYYLSFSYSIVSVFTYYCYLRLKDKIKYAFYGIVSGGVFYIILLLFACLGLRVCGGCPQSYCFACPLFSGYYLPAVSGVYIFLFGSQIIGIKKIYIFIFTFLGVVISYLFLKKTMK